MGIITGATFLIAGIMTQLFYTSSPVAVSPEVLVIRVV